jgi:glycerol kinase
MYLDGLAVNFWSSTDEIARLRGPDAIFEPAAARKDIEVRQAKWRGRRETHRWLEQSSQRRLYGKVGRPTDAIS